MPRIESTIDKLRDVAAGFGERDSGRVGVQFASGSALLEKPLTSNEVYRECHRYTDVRQSHEYPTPFVPQSYSLAVEHDPYHEHKPGDSHVDAEERSSTTGRHSVAEEGDRVEDVPTRGHPLKCVWPHQHQRRDAGKDEEGVANIGGRGAGH